MIRRALLISIPLLALGLLLAPTTGVASADKGTADEAKAMVEKAAALLKDSGPDKAFAAFDDPANKDFHDRDLYIFVRSMDGNTVAHGANKGMIGHTNLDLKDADGKPYNKEMIDLASSKGSGWVDYRWVNPVSHKIEPKSSFIVKVGDYVVGAGFYKD
ncbi:MAG TPA: cache domain-containing protein [Stellaceae bacterium]|nr:cache domain-containing protein [Stellaceae bacterium]